MVSDCILHIMLRVISIGVAGGMMKLSHLFRSYDSWFLWLHRSQFSMSLTRATYVQNFGVGERPAIEIVRAVNKFKADFGDKLFLWSVCNLPQTMFHTGF
ncbi:hypothetical protein WN944_026669 [Citrus x changshan-huyou]|uniref:Uncharacterized protein n=1 Tax=Citrus x changshan-huyou TaxID=2935761 RepID=A0AAP0QDH0_9ROSI